MKRSGSVLIYIIVWAIVLFSSFVIGICIREVRFYRARAATTNKIETTAKANLTKEKAGKEEQSAQKSSEKIPAGKEGEDEQLANLTAEQGSEGAMGNMRERMANMTEEERAQMRERFGGRRRGGGERFQNLSEEERAQMEERRRQMRERFENMSEEEREAFRAQRRRTGGRRSGGNGEESGSRQQDDSDDGGAPPPKGRACFVAETPVLVDGKLVQISKVIAGQKIGKQLWGSYSLEHVEEHEGTFECRDILLESGNSISVVDAHCFMLDSGKWMAAQNLTSSLKLKTLTGTVVIKSVTKRAVPYTGKVYNLKVKSSDQYMVGKDLVIVRDY